MRGILPHFGKIGFDQTLVKVGPFGPTQTKGLSTRW